jgi:hypothetical protein
MKALNVGTVPEFKEGRVNAPNPENFEEEIFRQREWNSFNTRVRSFEFQGS